MEQTSEVTQADREAAHSIIGTPHPTFSDDDAIFNRPDDHPYVQAFARHRLAATEQLQRENDALRDLLSDCRGYVVAVCQSGRVPVRHSPSGIIARIDALTTPPQQTEAEHG